MLSKYDQHHGTNMTEPGQQADKQQKLKQQAAKRHKKKLKPISQQSKSKCTQHKREANYPDGDTDWEKVFKRIKSDNSNFKIKRVRKLNKAIEHIHNKYNIQYDGDLDKRKGVIYVIYGKRDRRLYVGETIRTTRARYIQHRNKGNMGIRRNGECNSKIDQLLATQPLAEFGVMCVENVPQGERTKAQWKAELVNRETLWIRQLHTYQPRGFNEKGFTTTTAKVYNNVHRLPLNRNRNCFSEDFMLMDSPQAIKRRRREQLQNANVIPDIRELTPPQVQKSKRKISAKRAELLNANEEARHLRKRCTEENQDTDMESDEDIRATVYDQQIEDLIRKHKHAHATAPSTCTMWHRIELERPSND